MAVTATTEALLDERGKTHGDYEVTARIIQELKRIIALWGMDADGNDKLTASQRESLDMIANKIGRILAGDPNHADHWLDCSGYAMLIVRELEK
jgi:Domain of unknown function (DUF6378)